MVKTIVHSLHFTLIDSKMVAISFFLSLSQLALLIIQENFVPEAKYQLWKFGHVQNSLLLLLFFFLFIYYRLHFSGRRFWENF